MRNDGIFMADGAVRLLRVLPEPVERVWACLTEPALRAQWLAPGRLDLHIGGRLQLCFHHAERCGSIFPGPAPARYRDGGERISIAGRVTRCDPPALLSFTWDHEGETSRRSRWSWSRVTAV